MRAPLKTFVYLIGTALLAAVALLCWFCLYSRDLPELGALSQFAPATVRQTSDPCLGQTTSIPYDAIGANVRKALSAIEASENDPSALRAEFTGHDKLRRRTLSEVIAVTMFCTPSKELPRQFNELPTAIQLDRRYSRRQLFNIYANRVYLGSNLRGVEQGSQFYFHKNSRELTLPEAALLAGVVRSPSIYSPLTHSDRALQRRNEVLDAMVENGSITAAEAQTTKASGMPR